MYCKLRQNKHFSYFHLSLWLNSRALRTEGYSMGTDGKMTVVCTEFQMSKLVFICKAKPRVCFIMKFVLAEFCNSYHCKVRDNLLLADLNLWKRVSKDIQIQTYITLQQYWTFKAQKRLNLWTANISKPIYVM